MVPLEGLGAGVDVGGGGLRAEAEADDAAGDLLRQLQGGDDMAGLALVDGAVSDREAGFVNACADALRRHHDTRMPML